MQNELRCAAHDITYAMRVMMLCRLYAACYCQCMVVILSLEMKVSETYPSCSIILNDVAGLGF
jgi:hypothetical protein